MFSKILNFFKGNKNNPQIDFKVKDLGVGYVLDYNLYTWVVENEYIYDWGDGYMSKEWRISNGKDTLLLFYDDSEGLEISVSEKINVLQELNSIREEIIHNGVPSKSLMYEGKKWLLSDENPCLYSETGKDNVVEMVVWVFDDPTEKEFISFSQFGSKSIEGYKGKYIKEFEVSNILPASKK